MPRYKVIAEIVVSVEAEDEYEARDRGVDLMEWGDADISVEEDDEDA